MLHAQIVVRLEVFGNVQASDSTQSLFNGVNAYHRLWKGNWRKRDISDRIETGLLEVSHDYWLTTLLMLRRSELVPTRVCIDSCTELLQNLKVNHSNSLVA